MLRSRGVAQQEKVAHRNRERQLRLGDPLDAATRLPQPASQRSSVPLGGDLLDAVAEAVILPHDPCARSAAICSLVREVYETMEWLHGVGVHNDELDSLRRVMTEAQAHQRRMSALRDGTDAITMNTIR